MERIRDLLSFFIAAMAMVSLLCAVYQGMNDRNWSAGTLAGIFLVATLMFYIPRVVSISAWGVSAQLQNTLDRAEEIIERLKKLAEANARATYMSLAWGNRMGTPSAIEKQKVLDDIDAQLSALNVDKTKRQNIAEPLVAMIGVDLYFAYSRVMDRLVFWIDYAENRRLAGDQNSESLAQHQKFVNAVTDWRKANAGQSPYRDRQNYDLDTYLQRDIPAAILSDAQRSTAQTFSKTVLSLYEKCKEKGGFAPEAATFLDAQNGEDQLGAADRKVRELFGVVTTVQ
jgi:hypothetical protein